MPSRLRPYLFSGVGTRLPKYHIVVEENWVLLNTSVIILFVGLVDFLLLINKTIIWILLGYLTPLAFLYAAVPSRAISQTSLTQPYPPFRGRKKKYFA
jgi:hypothetical protein